MLRAGQEVLGAAHQLPEILVVLRERSAAQWSEAANPEGVTRAKRGIAAFMLCVVFWFLNPLSYQLLKAFLCSPFHLLKQVLQAVGSGQSSPGSS